VRHQHFALYSLLSNAHERDVIIVTQSSIVSVSSVLQGSVTDLLCKVLQVGPTEDVVITYRLKRAMYDYQKGHHLITNVVDDEHVFGQVECFLCRTDKDRWHILLRVFETVGYINHFHSYAIKETCPLVYQLLTFSDLFDRHAVCCCMKMCRTSKINFVRMPYYVF
jgi:hypothetical protein